MKASLDILWQIWSIEPIISIDHLKSNLCTKGLIAGCSDLLLQDLTNLLILQVWWDTHGASELDTLINSITSSAEIRGQALNTNDGKLCSPGIVLEELDVLCILVSRVFLISNRLSLIKHRKSIRKVVL